MAPLKFEDNIKQELEKRVLTPSDSAWDKLETKLKTINKSNKNQKWWFMGLAASLVGIFLVTSLVFQEKGEIEFPNNQVVDIEQEQQVDGIVNPNTDFQTTPVNNTIEESVAKVETTPQDKGSSTQQKLKARSFTPNQQIAVETSVQNNESKSQEESMSFKEIKAQEVVAQIETPLETNSQVGDAEIESLLNSAQEDIANQNSFNQETNTVDAVALLEDVEIDLERTFRDKVFESLKSSMQNVSTAIAQRNN